MINLILSVYFCGEYVCPTVKNVEQIIKLAMDIPKHCELPSLGEASTYQTRLRGKVLLCLYEYLVHVSVL